MILFIIHNYLFWWISTFMESTYFIERWLTSYRGTPNIPNLFEVRYTLILYLFTAVIVVQKKSDVLPNCLFNFVPPLTVSSWYFYRAPINNLTVSEEPPSNTSFFNTSQSALVIDYYQVTARFYGPSSNLYALGWGDHSK